MRTKKATAPETLTLVLSQPVVSFTIAEIAKRLDISYKHARAAVNFGVSEDKLRVISSPQKNTGECAKYENASWRRYWLTKSWRS
jgi:hypothetical protein